MATPPPMDLLVTGDEIHFERPRHGATVGTVTATTVRSVSVDCEDGTRAHLLRRRGSDYRVTVFTRAPTGPVLGPLARLLRRGAPCP